MKTMIYTIIHRKLWIELHERHKQPGVNACAPRGLAVPDPLVTVTVRRCEPHLIRNIVLDTSIR